MKFQMMGRLFTSMALAAAVLMVAPVPGAVAGPPREGGELVVGLSYEPSKIDPHRTAANYGVLAVLQAGETLVLTNPDGSFAPGLAKSWEISEDGTRYTFKLRSGIKFHDGTPFNAAAVKYNFDRIMDPATKSEEAIDRLGPYLKTEVMDDLTAVVHLKSPFAPLLDGMADGRLCMVSPTAAAKWGPEEFQDHFVGTGPFIFKEWKRHEHIKLEKNPDYWGGPEFFSHHGKAYLDAVVFKFVGESSVRSGALETGELNVASEIVARDIKRLEDNKAVNVVSRAQPGTSVMLLFNMSKPPMDDIRVRQALNYALNQKDLSQILYQGVHGPAYGVLSPTSKCYWPGGEKMYAYNQEKAKALLEEAGWKDSDGDGIRDKDGKPLRLDYPFHSKFPRFRDPAPIIQSQLKEVGIDVNLMPVAAPSWLEAGRTGNQHFGILHWNLTDPGNNLRIMFHSANAKAFSWTRHGNKHLDELLDQGMQVADLKKRCPIYEEVQQIVMNEAMIKPLHLWSDVWGMRAEVKGIIIDNASPSSFYAFAAYLDK